MLRARGAEEMCESGQDNVCKSASVVPSKQWLNEKRLKIIDILTGPEISRVWACVLAETIIDELFHGEPKSSRQ